MKLSSSKVDCMNIAEVQIFNQDNVNIAIGKTVTMSSGYAGNDMFPGKNLVNTNTSDFAHTSCGDKGWMKIDLGEPTHISKITVFNRVDCCQFRLIGTIVEIINVANVTVFTSPPLTSEMVQDILTV